MLHIYIVSLKQDVEKREVISNTLEELGLQFSFIDAIYGKDLSEEVLNSIRAKSVGKLLNRKFPLTPGEIGCSLSHLAVYQNILDHKLDWACILEDDVILDKRFKNFINTFKGNELNPESLYILGGQNRLVERQIIKSIRNIKIIGGQKFPKTIKSEAVIYGTCCYLMNAALAEKLIKEFQTKFMLADDWSYLVSIDVIKNIYLSNFVDHPFDLSGSLLQKERELGLSNVEQKKYTFLLRVKGAIKWRIRTLSLKALRHLEKREMI